MKPYAFHLVHQYDREVFDHIRRLVQLLPDEIELGKDETGEAIILSCHILARAVFRFFPVKVQSGYLLNCWEHSWLVGPRLSIIDVYPVAILGGPILVNTSFGSPSFLLYKSLPINVFNAVYGERFEKPSFKKAVDMVAKYLEERR